MSYGVELGDKVLIRGFVVKREADNRVWVQMDRAEGLVIIEWFDIGLLVPEVAVEQALDPVYDERNSAEPIQSAATASQGETEP